MSSPKKKNLKMALLVKKTTDKLNKGEIKSIVMLKNKVWNFGVRSQKRWFSNFVKTKDVHILGKKNKKLIAYTLLRNRNYLISSRKNSYIYLDTFIAIDKTINAFLLMKFIKKYIKKKKCFLVCEKKFVKLYSVFKFEIINKKKFKIIDYKVGKKVLMTLNLKHNFKYINIYLNS